MSTEPEFKRYLFHYRHEGASWAFEVKATSPEDARARVSQMALAQYDGEIAIRIPVPAGSFMRRLMMWWRR